MATIARRTDSKGKVHYQVKVRRQGAPAQTATFKRKTDAEKWAASIETAINEGRALPTIEARRHTVADLIDRYLVDVLPRKKAKTQGPQRQQLEWWRAEIGGYSLANLTPALIAEKRDWLAHEPIPSPASDASPTGPARHRTGGTVNRYLAALSHALSIGIKEYGWLESNPVLRVARLKEPRGRVRFLDDDERERLLAACRASSNRDLHLAVVLSLASGARQQEIMGLRWPQIDFTRRVAVISETKNGETRLLSLSGPALELLRERSKVRRLDTDLVFPATKRSRRKHNHQPAPQEPRPINLRAPWEKALSDAGIEDFRWHDLRHTAASYLAMSGASLAEIAEVLGHKTLAMVKRYSHLSEAHTASVVERMNAKFIQSV